MLAIGLSNAFSDAKAVADSQRCSGLLSELRQLTPVPFRHFSRIHERRRYRSLTSALLSIYSALKSPKKEVRSSVWMFSGLALALILMRVLRSVLVGLNPRRARDLWIEAGTVPVFAPLPAGFHPGAPPGSIRPQHRGRSKPRIGGCRFRQLAQATGEPVRRRKLSQNDSHPLQHPLHSTKRYL